MGKGPDRYSSRKDILMAKRDRKCSTSQGMKIKAVTNHLIYFRMTLSEK